jgi:hypothetical protein
MSLLGRGYYHRSNLVQKIKAARSDLKVKSASRLSCFESMSV